MHPTTEEQIIEELKKGDRLASELKIALGIQKYPELWSAIARLESEGKIKHYFVLTPPSATLAYRLVKQELSKPILPWGSKDARQPA